MYIGKDEVYSYVIGKFYILTDFLFPYSISNSRAKNMFYCGFEYFFL